MPGSSRNFPAGPAGSVAADQNTLDGCQVERDRRAGRARGNAGGSKLGGEPVPRSANCLHRIATGTGMGKYLVFAATPAPARKRIVLSHSLVKVPVPPTESKLPRPTSMAKSDPLPSVTLVAVTVPPPVIESVPPPVEPTERLLRWSRSSRFRPP